jgi:septin family protein
VIVKSSLHQVSISFINIIRIIINLFTILVDDTLEKTVEIVSQTVELEEKGVRLRLTIVDTPGFGDSINSNNWYILDKMIHFMIHLKFFSFKSWKPITNYIDEKLEKYYLHESGYGVDRKKFHDQRVHCCLYFIPPYVRG